MTQDIESNINDLEKRTVEAHRSYVAALAELEQIELHLDRPVFEDENARENYRQSHWAAEQRKEKLRLVFRDLCDELGYIPRGYGIGLPEEQRMHDRDN